LDAMDSGKARVDATAQTLLTGTHAGNCLHMKFIRRAAALYCASFAILVSTGALTLHSVRAQEAQADVPRMPFDHLLFTTSSHCMSCHSQVHAPDGEDISIGIQWRASVMANS